MHLDAKETADIWGVNGTGLNDQDSGELDMAEVKRALMALDVDEEELLGWGEEGSCSTAIMQAIDTNHAGKVSLEELTAAVRLQRFLGVQDGRYYVLLSLREAETLRAAIHARSDEASLDRRQSKADRRTACATRAHLESVTRTHNWGQNVR